MKCKFFDIFLNDAALYTNFNFALFTWYHVGCVVTGGIINSYVNGNNLGTLYTNYMMPYGIRSTCLIGYSNFFENTISGIIDEIRIYNKPLTSS